MKDIGMEVRLTSRAGPEVIALTMVSGPAPTVWSAQGRRLRNKSECWLVRLVGHVHRGEITTLRPGSCSFITTTDSICERAFPG